MLASGSITQVVHTARSEGCFTTFLVQIYSHMSWTLQISTFLSILPHLVSNMTWNVPKQRDEYLNLWCQYRRFVSGKCNSNGVTTKYFAYLWTVSTVRSRENKLGVIYQCEKLYLVVQFRDKMTIVGIIDVVVWTCTSKLQCANNTLAR